jgi:hypothetical protein
MIKTMYVFLVVSCLTLVSCGNDIAFEREATEVMAIHDEVMPMMSDMVKLRRQLDEEMKGRDSSEQIAFQMAVRQLVIAEKGMWDWMATYSKPEKADEGAMQYLAEQKKAIQAVSDAMRQSYAHGQELLGQ